MRIDVIGSPDIYVDGKQNINVSHLPNTDITTIICHADVVTVGIAIRVLSQKFEEAIEQLPEGDIHTLQVAIEEAVG